MPCQPWIWCCAAEGQGVAASPVPTWRSPHLSFVEKVFSLLWHKICPLHELTGLTHQDPEQLAAFRKAFTEKFDGQVQKAITKGGFNEQEVRFSQSGTEVSITIFRPPGHDAEKLPLLYWLHGGGFTIGSAREMVALDAMTRLMGRGKPMVFAIPNYRLAPEHPFPAAHDDVLAGFVHLLETAGLSDELGFDPENVHVYGISAGGGLVAGFTDALARRGGRCGAAVKSVVLDQPMLNPLMDTASYITESDARIAPVPWLKWCWEVYLRDYPGGTKAALSDPRLCPHLASGEGLPRFLRVPYFVVTASGDPLKDDGAEYARRMREAGAAVTLIKARGCHAFALSFDTAARDALFGPLAKLVGAPRTADGP